MNDDTLQLLFKTLLERRDNPSENSYTATLLAKGVDKILKKVGEEATELVIASKGGERSEIVYETADLLYHTLVLLVHHDIPLDEVYGELRRRFGISGIEEKSARG
ncbi:MAG: phosphoribosyl-ATP diphosphatase [Geobacteraceae bacterium]|nr:phosphoribosyl-ATP diphosphatase [Geobacteraceae bacterium]